jgi:two-component system response regulator RegX3
MSRKTRILVVEDEPAIRTGLVDVLVFHGYEVESAADGIDGRDKALAGRFDLVVLDIMLPGLSGFDVCDAIRRADRDLAVIMLTARVSDDDIVRGLELGADDYVAKPFSIAQLLLRIKAVLRRSRGVDDRPRRLALGDALEIDVANLTGQRGRESIAFTRREMDLLLYLHEHADRAVPREELLARVWGYANHRDIETRTVDIHVAKLRRKIESGSTPSRLITVRGAGYRLIVPG